jgi:hypothetical protein
MRRCASSTSRGVRSRSGSTIGVSGVPDGERCSPLAEGVPALTGGTWRATRDGDEVHLALEVTRRWRPGPLPPLMRTVTSLVPVFRRWPTTYRWSATSYIEDEYQRDTGTVRGLHVARPTITVTPATSPTATMAATAGRSSRSLPPDRQPRLPVGEPGHHRPAAPRARGRAPDGGGRADHDWRSWSSTWIPAGSTPCSGSRASRTRSRLACPATRGASPSRRSWTAHRPGRHQRLQADHARPVHAVDGPPPRRRPSALPGVAARRDRRGHRGRLPRREQRRVRGRVRGQPPTPTSVPTRLFARLDWLDRPARHPALPGRRQHHRGGRAAVHHARAVRRRLPQPLQVQPVEADRDAGAVGLRAGPVPDARVRGHDRLRAHQAALLRGAQRHQPDRHRAAGARPVWWATPALPRGARWSPLR